MDLLLRKSHGFLLKILQTRQLLKQFSTTLLNHLRALAVLLHPVMPATTEILWESLGANATLGEIGAQEISKVATWGQLPEGATVTKTPVLFPRLEVKE
jgi:methionyl-tRNA synthetase